MTNLEKIANEKRLTDKNLNIYSKDNEYNSNHPNATMEQGSSDDLNNNKGKATGNKFDFRNGGSNTDINGNPNISNTGRKAIFLKNNFNPNYTYLEFLNEQ